MINATIGTAEFFAMQGRLPPPQSEFAPIDESWEDGHGYVELGIKSDPVALICHADFDTATKAQNALIDYAKLKLELQEIQVNIGGGTVIYPNYKILKIEDITEYPFSPTVSGGIDESDPGAFELVTRWTVQQVTGSWD